MSGIFTGKDEHGRPVSIIIEYLRMQIEYEAKYGERTIILLNMGTFFEIYGYDPNYCLTDEAKIDRYGQIWNEIVGHAVEASVLLNARLTQENGKEPYSIMNPHKLGFPIVAYEKYKETLLRNDFLIIRVDQEAKVGSGRVGRYIAEVVSPTTEINEVSLNRVTSNIACLYVEYQAQRADYENFLITTGIAVVDILTGDNIVCEFYSSETDEVRAIQEIYRFLVAHRPREIIVHVDDMPDNLSLHSEEHPNPYLKYLETALELRRFDRRALFVNDVPADYKKPDYQVNFLNKIFSHKPGPTQSKLNIVAQRNDHIIEHLSLERMNYGRIAYALLLQHCYNHNPDIIARLSKPQTDWLDSDRHLILTHNAIVQLDLISHTTPSGNRRKRTEIDSLLSVLDGNMTPLGKRALQSILQNPLSDTDEIERSYSMIEEMQTVKIENQPLWQVVERKLKELPDIGRLQRKLELRLITPKEMAVLYTGYTRIVNLYIDIVSVPAPTLHSHLLKPQQVTNFNQYLARYGAIFDFAALECCVVETSENKAKWIRFDTCPLKLGIYTDVDAYVQDLTSATDHLQRIADHLSLHLANTRGNKISLTHERKKVGATAQDGIRTLITTTPAKARTLMQAHIDTQLCGILESHTLTTSETIVTSSVITELCQRVDAARLWLYTRLYTIYLDLVDEMVRHYTFYSGIIHLVATVDLMHCYAKIAYRNNYFRPQLDTQPGASYVTITDLRHPVIEQLIEEQYVTNNITLESNGMLLYGVNQTGKTSLAKAIALNVILAQIGCYTAGHVRLRVFRRLITRLSGSDNMFKGESSFAVEMTELRTILRQSDDQTLVIGDELCHGTETHSGMAITAGAIITLLERRACFLFATHMHELVKLPCIQDIPDERLQVCHLSVDYDESNEILMYDRKLQSGSGSPLYGLIVAQSLNLPGEFLTACYSILPDIVGRSSQLLSTQRSRYHSGVYMDACALCQRMSPEVVLHTHHIQHQANADERGLIGSMPKNSRNNLVVLCQPCHENLHAEHHELTAVSTGTGTVLIAN